MKRPELVIARWIAGVAMFLTANFLMLRVALPGLVSAHDTSLLVVAWALTLGLAMLDTVIIGVALRRIEKTLNSKEENDEEA